MDLFYRKTGRGPVLVILHGLYGSSDNWLTVSRFLQDDFEVVIPDLRNHGHSFHSSEFNYDVLTEDVTHFIQNHCSSSPCILLGHSMGGKTAMHVAKKHPGLLSHLIIADIAPRNYFADIHGEATSHVHILEVLSRLYLPSIKTREEADRLLAFDLPDTRLRSFLLKNMKRNKEGQFEWMLNLPAIKTNFIAVSEGFSIQEWEPACITGFPVLFIKGGQSDYIQPEDLPVIKRIFPTSEVAEIPGTGHWLHADKPQEFASMVKQYVL